MVVLGVAQIYFSTQLATKGKKITTLEKETQILEEENKNLKSEIASFGGLNKLLSLAAEKGFTKDFQIINLSSKVPVALNP